MFLIRKNLYLFLEHLYEHFGGVSLRYLWADAICIDQDGLKVAEKGHQVQQMSAIYRSAVEVLAWLGLSADPADRDLFESMNQCLSERQQRQESRKTSSDAWRCFSVSLGKDSERYAAWLALCNRSYWTRLWIVQELVLGKTARVICGAHEISLEALWKIWSNQPVTRQEIGKSEELMLYVYKMKAWDRSETLLGTVNKFKHLECVKLHDRVLAMLGIAQHGESIAVDYGIAIPKLFLDVLRAGEVNESLEDVAGLATALKISVKALENGLQLNSATDTPISSGHVEESLRYQVKLPRHLGFVPFTRRVENEFEGFQWYWEALPSGHSSVTPVNARLRTAMEDENCRCTCRLCNCNQSVPSPALEDFEWWTTLSMPAVQARTQSGTANFSRGFYMIFERQSYVVTILDLDPDNAVGSPDSLLWFHDPFWAHWQIESDIPNEGWVTRRLISMPLL